ncbi:MAG: LLM class flavin-dependent oxidoreductase, partial [Dehalococcoidia bacterium]|nr:LLM class flavin-dependent oxidoreductase [Dehalococcoidia bacterium]
MRVGLYINPQTPGPDDDGRVIREVFSQIDLAEDLGFEDVWLTEHHFSNYNAYSDPVLLAAALSQRVKTMTVGFSLAVVPFHHPVRFVTQMNLLDNLFEGRFIVGVGPGNSPEEYAGFGLDARERHAMQDEFMAVVEAAWRNDGSGFSYSGKYYNGAVKGRIIPEPFTKPHPPVAWATLTPDTIYRIATKGYSWLMGPQQPQWVAPRVKKYMQGLDAGNLTDEQRARAWFGTGILRQIYCAAPGEDWMETLGPYIETYIRKSALANTGIDTLSKEDFERRKAGYLGNWLIAGTAEELREKLIPYARLGARHLMCWVNFGHLPDHLIKPSMMRFAADVLPALNEATFDPAYVDE